MPQSFNYFNNDGAFQHTYPPYSEALLIIDNDVPGWYDAYDVNDEFLQD